MVRAGAGQRPGEEVVWGEVTIGGEQRRCMGWGTFIGFGTEEYTNTNEYSLFSCSGGCGCVERARDDQVVKVQDLFFSYMY
jgi:hypothetical protein